MSSMIIATCDDGRLIEYAEKDYQFFIGGTPATLAEVKALDESQKLTWSMTEQHEWLYTIDEAAFDRAHDAAFAAHAEKPTEQDPANEQTPLYGQTPVYGQPVYPQRPVYASPSPQPKKNKTGIIIAIIIAAVLLLGCCCCGGSLLVFRSVDWANGSVNISRSLPIEYDDSF